MNKNILQIWKNKGKILEGIKNSIFKSDDIELIAAERLAICKECPLLDWEGTTCLVPGTKPCCGLCGCDMHLKTRSLSSACSDEDNPRWHPVLSEEEEDILKNSINYQEPNQNSSHGNSIQSRES